LVLARHHLHLRFVVQDHESIMGDAVEVRDNLFQTRYLSNRSQYWKKNMPDALISGRVKLQASPVFFHPLGVGITDIWGLKATASLTRNLRGRRTSQSSSSPK
jgi:hypothetical protein